MIADEKTLNKLYADTGTVLFTLDDKPEAARKMMEAIKDTPEYLQLMNLLPSHAQDDPKADWWQTEDADHLVAELLHVLGLYTPDGFTFGPVSGRTYGFGYGNTEDERKMLYRIEIELDRGYVYGEKNEYGKKKRHYAELAGICRLEGYATELKKRAKGCRIVKGNTELHAHYGWITGYCEAMHLSQFIILLLREGRKFRFRTCKILDSVFNFTEEEEYKCYQQQYKATIYYQVFDLFRRKPWAVTDNLMEIASTINIPTQSRPQGFDCNSPAYRYVRSAYQKLSDMGYLEEYTHTLGIDELNCAKVTPEGISKNIFYGTQL